MYELQNTRRIYTLYNTQLYQIDTLKTGTATKSDQIASGVANVTDILKQLYSYHYDRTM